MNCGSARPLMVADMKINGTWATSPSRARGLIAVFQEPATAIGRHMLREMESDHVLSPLGQTAFTSFSSIPAGP